MLEPVKPLTTPTPSFCAARAVFFISSAARCVDAGRIAVAPDVRRQDGLVPLVDVVQHRLADQVVADGEHLQVVLFQQLALLGAVVVLGQGLVDLEVVAPAGQLQAVVAEFVAFPGQFGHGQVGPLAGEQRYRSSHVSLLELVMKAGIFPQAVGFRKWGGTMHEVKEFLKHPLRGTILWNTNLH